MAGRRSNGEGSISYDSRRKRYRAKVTIGWELNPETGKSKQIVKTLGSNYKTKGEAASALSEYLKTPFDIDNKNITFSELYSIWFDDWIVDHESHRYRAKAAYKYCSSLYEKKMRDITIIDMKHCINNGSIIETRGKYKGELKTASPSTKESMKYLFNHMFSYAVEARIVDRNFAKDFSLDKKVAIEKEQNHKDKSPFTENEMDTLWRSIEFVPFADMIIYACYSGWRPSELVKIKMENVHIAEGYIQGGIKTDSGKNRIVPIHPLVINIVKKYYDDAMSVGSKFLFNDINKKKGIGLSYDQYLTRFNKVMEQLKFSIEYTPHYTRHTFITKAKRAHMDEYILKLISGHKEKDITEHVYTHRELSELIDEMNRIEK